MTALEIVLVALCAALLGVSLFAISELRKKYRLIADHLQREGTAQFDWLGARKARMPCGMHTIVLTANKPFSALIGYRINVFSGWLFDGVDCYGQVTGKLISDGTYRATFSTFLGNKPMTFLFSSNVEGIQVILYENDQIAPDAVFPPHWWQRLGLWA